MLLKRLSAPSEIAAQSSMAKTLGQINVLIITFWVFRIWQHGVAHWKRNQIALKMNCSLATIDWHWQTIYQLKHFGSKKQHNIFYRNFWLQNCIATYLTPLDLPLKGAHFQLFKCSNWYQMHFGIVLQRLLFQWPPTRVFVHNFLKSKNLLATHPSLDSPFQGVQFRQLITKTTKI